MKEISGEQTFRICRSLQDASCRASQVTLFLSLEQRQCPREQYRLLSCKKAALLQKLHRIQYKIDCLHHLVYTMQQADEKEWRTKLCKKQTL